LNWEGSELVKPSNRGKAVILGIFLLALVLSGYAWWHQYRQGPRCRDFFGTEAVQLIRLAPRVDLLRLTELPVEESAPDSSATVLEIAGIRVRVSDEVEVTGTPGMLHARHALLQDHNYHWDKPTADCMSRWEFALRFSGDGNDTVIAFDAQCNQIGLSGSERTAPFVPELMATYAKKSHEWEDRANDARAE